MNQLWDHGNGNAPTSEKRSGYSMFLYEYTRLEEGASVGAISPNMARRRNLSESCVIWMASGWWESREMI